MPSTTIRILKNCPLDTSYDHTLYFATKAAQTDYFKGLTKYNLTNQTYQRVKRGYMRVQYKAEDLYDCNYIMFQNASFGDKWFYAFITSVEYVNNITSEIRFQIDAMQTWFFDYTLDTCFVEREHSVTDVAGENLVTENIGYGDYVIASQEYSGKFTDWVIVVIRAASAIGQLNTGGFYGKLFSQCEYETYELDGDGVAGIHDLLQLLSILNNDNSVLDIFMLPRAFVPTKIANQPDPNPYSTIAYCTGDTGSLGTYTPRNKKLLTYPYQLLDVDNMQGENLELHYEYFNHPAVPQFKLIPSISTDSKIVLTPVNYKGYNVISDSLSMASFPKCPYATNDFAAKVVQAGMGVALASLTKGASIPVTTPKPYSPSNAPALPPPKLDKTGYFEIPEEQPMRTYDIPSIAQIAAITGGLGNLLRGANTRASNANSGNAWFNMGKFDFQFTKKTIRPEFARIIDDYFDRFGYATMRNKVPNTHSRPHWNYVKTQACTITGSIPCDDAQFICSLYDRGITFWKSGSEVGNYSLDNSPT